MSGSIYTQETYDTYASAASSMGSRIVEFIPHNATDLTLRWLTDGGGSILSYTSPSPPTASLCKDATLTGKPKVDAQWWPETAPAKGMVCSTNWRVFSAHGVTYAWSTKSIAS
jgi:hypothetical protein